MSVRRDAGRSLLTFSTLSTYIIYLGKSAYYNRTPRLLQK